MGKEARDSFVGWLRARLAERQQAAQDASQGSEQVHEHLGGTAICDACGRTILLGEKTSRLRRDEREVDVCCLCETRILAQGFLRAA
jgi:hypothetical protein